MNFINKINKYLLEHYPLIWNTRLFWMLNVNILVHLLFFIIGFSSVNGLEDLKEFSSLSSFFYETSNVYYNVLISIFIILIWVVFYLRNNAFKNVYSVKKAMLFQQFCILFFIIFISISQYFSFKKGLTTKVKSLYSWEETDADIKIFNRTALFLTQDQDEYEIDKKKYPAPFPLKIAKMYNYYQEDNIDTTKEYLKYKGNNFQFYKIDEGLWQKDQQENTYEIGYSKKDFKYRIVKDITEFKYLLHPSLYNYSKQEFGFGQDSLDYKKQLNDYQKILESKDKFKTIEELQTFLRLANKYKAKHNLELESWFQLIGNKPNYLLKNLIGKSDPTLDDFTKSKYNYNNNNSLTDNIPYSKVLYFNFNNIDNFFKNVHESYFPDFNIELFYFLLVFSIFLATLLFIFKTTNIKTLLLSFVASLVVLVLIVWLMSSARDLFGDSKYKEYLIMIFISTIIIILSIISYVLKWRKIIVSIFWSLAVFSVPILCLFAGLLYIKVLKEKHMILFPKDYDYRSNFDLWFIANGFLTIIVLWLITVLVYSLYIRKLRARAE